MKMATLRQASALLALLREKRVSSQRLKELIDRGLLPDLLDADPSRVDRSAFQKMLGLVDNPWTQLYHTMGISEENISRDFTEAHFPIGTTPAYKYRLVVVHFGRDISDEELLAVFKARGLKIPGPEDAMTYAADHPDEQKKYLIFVRVARPWRCRGGSECVPFLGNSTRGRCLYLNFIDGRRGDNWRFLARCPA